MGGDMDGMGDLDNAPMPPMGPDDMGGEDPMGGAPDDMGGEPPMDENPLMGGDDLSQEDNEVLDVANNLTTKDKATWLEYGKSMEKDDSDEVPEPMGGEMPMESKRGMKSIIDEVLNDVLDSQEGTKRPEKKMPRQYRDMEMPFKSPF
jgi:hypothetical protein